MQKKHNFKSKPYLASCETLKTEDTSKSMLESLVNPKRAERKPWEMFLVGSVYACLSVIIANILFAQNSVLSSYIGIFIITFTVIFSMPFMYYAIRLEEKKDREYEGGVSLLKEHGKALSAFLWLFLGFIVAFSVCYMIFDNGPNFFRAQVETFCQINRPDNFNQCLTQYGLNENNYVTGGVLEGRRLMSIFSNNIGVLIFTLIFSLVFGAGAIFILAWNASVIAAAIGIFTKSSLVQLPIGLLRYMIHGLPEIAAYFISAMAGGILSIAIIKRDFKSDKIWKIIEDSLNLIVLSILILFIAALIEVFITPKLF